ncbi:SAVED domain-containing protein [Massilia sp. SR12]
MPKPVPQPSTTIDDDTLHMWLSDCLTRSVKIVLAHERHRCALYAQDLPSKLLLADPVEKGVKLLQKLAKAGQLKRLELEVGKLDGATDAQPEWLAVAIVATESDVKDWIKARKALFDLGRGKALSSRSIQRVWHDAAGRCMFRGCGDDLGVTPLTTRSAAVAYLAHIIAADKDGPRGDETWSEKLADEPSNIMLMCDKHHRLIDRIAADEYKTHVLREMRAEHVNTVQQVLSCLKYPKTQAIAMLANLGNATTWPSEVDMQLAMLDRALAPLPLIDYQVPRNQRDDRSLPCAWRQILHEHEMDLRTFVGKFGNTRSVGATADVLSIFTVHLVPLLVLFGRIVGQARRVEVYQYDRDRGTWRWESGAVAKPAGTMFLEHSVRNSGKAVLLSIELTAEFPDSALPPEIVASLCDESMQRVRIRTKAPGQTAIAHALDLEQFTRIAREAVNLVQDQLHATHVHLIGVSPACALFNFGQLLQAGNHCPYTIYDRPTWQTPFLPAITIDGSQISAIVPAGEAPSITIPLR